MSWLAAAPAALVAAAVVLGPGLLAAAPLRTGLLARIALAPVATVVCSGAAGVLFGAVGLRFHLWQVLVVAAAGCAVAWLLRRRLPQPVIAPAPIRPAALAAVWAGSAIVLGLVAFVGVPDPDRISQTYDNVFHLSAISAVLDGESASALTLRSLIETGGGLIHFYPSAWHQLAVMVAQLSGASVAVSVNALWLAVSTLVWLPGLAWLTQVLLPRTAAAALVALPLGVAFGAMPYALLAWGTIYPTFLAHALLPAAVTVAVLTVRALAGTGDRRAAMAGLAGTAVTVAALAVCHPRVVPTWAVIVAPLIVWLLCSSFLRAWREGGDVRRRAVRLLGTIVAVVLVAAAAGFWYLVSGLGLFERPLEERLGGPQAKAPQDIPASIWQVLSQQAMTGVAGGITAVAPLLALAVLVGAVAAWRVRGLRWVVVGYLIVAALFVLAAGSDDVFAKLATAIWYKDRFRLAAALPVLAVPLASLGLLAICRLGLRAWHRAGGDEEAEPTPRQLGVVAPAASAVVAVATAVGIALSGASAATASVFRMPHDHAHDAVVSKAQVAFMAGIGEHVPPDQLVLGDPWDGSALTGLFGGRRPVFPHVNGNWDQDRQALAWRLSAIDTDPTVCQALNTLRVRYLLFNPHEFGGGDPSGNHFPGPHAAVAAGLFTEVATDGESVLYRIDQCGPLP